MIAVPTYTATIYVGLRPGYQVLARHSTIEDVKGHCRDFCDEVGLCVTVTPTTFVYKDGIEPGAIVGLINYPRFPKKPKEIRDLALRLASILALKLKQKRVSVVCPEETIMIGEVE